MRRRAAVMYTLDARGRALACNDWVPRPPPLVHLFRTAQDRFSILAAALPDALADSALALLDAEPRTSTPRTPLRCADALCALLEGFAGGVAVSGGPAFMLPIATVDPPGTRSLAPSASWRCAAGIEDYTPDIPHQQPFCAAFVDGEAVAVCSSARIGAEVHEASVATDPAWRRRGHAAAATARWAREVAARGATACYSTGWDNIASQRVAARLGAHCYGDDVTVHAASMPGPPQAPIGA